MNFSASYNIDARLVCFRFDNGYRTSVIHHPQGDHFEMVIVGPGENIVLSSLCEEQVLGRLAQIARLGAIFPSKKFSR